MASEAVSRFKVAIRGKSVEEIANLLNQQDRQNWAACVAVLDEKVRGRMVAVLKQRHEAKTAAAAAAAGSSSSNKKKADSKQPAAAAASTSGLRTLAALGVDATTLRETPLLDAVRRALFTFGDAQECSEASATAAHHYLNHWLAALMTVFDRCDSQAGGKGAAATKFMAFLSEVFPQEMSEYDKKKAVTSKATGAMDDEGEDIDALTHMAAAAQEQPDGEAAAPTAIHDSRSPSADSLLPPDRFFHRLAFRDARSKAMKGAAYSAWHAAEQQLFTGKKKQKAFKDYVKGLLAAMGADKDSRVPVTNGRAMEALAFLVHDRLTSLVEIAMRIDHSQQQQHVTPMSLPSLSEALQAAAEEAADASPLGADAYRLATALLDEHVDGCLADKVNGGDKNGRKREREADAANGGEEASPKRKSTKAPPTMDTLDTPIATLLDIKMPANESEALWCLLPASSRGLTDAASLLLPSPLQIFQWHQLRSLLWAHRTDDTMTIEQLKEDMITSWGQGQLGRGPAASAVAAAKDEADKLRRVIERIEQIQNTQRLLFPTSEPSDEPSHDAVDAAHKAPSARPAAVPSSSRFAPRVGIRRGANQMFIKPSGGLGSTPVSKRAAAQAERDDRARDRLEEARWEEENGEGDEGDEDEAIDDGVANGMGRGEAEADEEETMEYWDG
ncbi:unnamed protein product [Vitrella brassicaformis CCMP3155]|uniref:Uncharacterized protein n=2 Tax=Vitrella brassicaformis TaxID=1169539 RepID=A0A0G4FX00_VITBC|nr:unnamed protein product [Vitrella brassicaformis CCMP3155]|eukprot:CEM19476.1 unnamed protein product [Vitrella brassicaformis CCMP3155]